MLPAPRRLVQCCRRMELHHSVTFTAATHPSTYFSASLTQSCLWSIHPSSRRAVEAVNERRRRAHTPGAAQLDAPSWMYPFSCTLVRLRRPLLDRVVGRWSFANRYGCWRYVNREHSVSHRAGTASGTPNVARLTEALSITRLGCSLKAKL